MLSPILILMLSDETVSDTDTFAKSVGDTFAATIRDGILFVVVICADIFISWPFLVTKTIFSNECHTQQRNLKIRKVRYTFQTTEVPCNFCTAVTQ